MSKIAIGADLGGSHLSVGFVDHKGSLREKKKIKIDNTAPPKITLELVADVIQSLLTIESRVCGIGLGLPGNHDSKRGICNFSPNFPEWKEVRVTDFLSKRLKRDVWMLNDVRMATFGEMHFGAGKEVNTFVMLAVGTGIGGGVVVNRKLLIGPQEAAGEIGHMTILPNGPPCNCGNHGCLEALAAAPSITAQGAEAVLHDRSPILKKKIHQLEDLNPKIIFESAEEGDEACRKILEATGEAIGLAFSSLAAILNPDLFILGGGVAQIGKPLFNSVYQTVRKRLHILKSATVKIVPPSLGLEAGVIGSGAYALLKADGVA